MAILTPTVKLNSFAMTKQVIPTYTEESCEKKTKSETLFKFKLQFEGLEVEGCGKTKKKAKHMAASKMLEKLKEKYPKLEYFKENTVLTVEVTMLKKLQDKKITPIFEYIREEGSSENRFYTVQCTVGGLKVTGTGKGRKNARIAACEKVLAHLLSDKAIPEPDKSDKKDTSKEKPKIMEKLEGCIFEDPVSVLQEYLVHSNLDPPAYSTTVQDKVYSISCRAGTISYSASARNKKLAKQCAAAGVLDIIGVKERPKKKPKRKPMRNNRYKFRYVSPGSGQARHYGFDSVLTRPKIYEPSKRAINFSRRNPDEESHWIHTQQRNVQNYYDMF